jgi:hypothetical protein
MRDVARRLEKRAKPRSVPTIEIPAPNDNRHKAKSAKGEESGEAQHFE